MIGEPDPATAAAPNPDFSATVAVVMNPQSAIRAESPAPPPATVSAATTAPDPEKEAACQITKLPLIQREGFFSLVSPQFLSSSRETKML